MVGAGPAGSAMRPPVHRASRRHSALLCVAAAVSAWFLTFAAVPGEADGPASASAFVVGPAPRGIPARRAGHVALRAEAGGQVVDAELADGGEDAAEAPESVFDGPVQTHFKQKYKGNWYEVDKRDWTYKLEKEGGDVEEGKWARAWNMPEQAFKREEKRLKRAWRAKKRKLRIKHGMGQKWPNGKYIFLAKLQGSPFTREQYGEKYVGRAEWHFSPNEIPARERQMRAHALKRRLEQGAEEKRVERLRELGVWPGEQSWRRPWRPKVDLTPSGPKGRS